MKAPLPDFRISEIRIGRERAARVTGLLLEPVNFELDELRVISERIQKFLRGAKISRYMQTVDIVDAILKDSAHPLSVEQILVKVHEAPGYRDIKQRPLYKCLRANCDVRGWKNVAPEGRIPMMWVKE